MASVCCKNNSSRWKKLLFLSHRKRLNFWVSLWCCGIMGTRWISGAPAANNITHTSYTADFSFEASCRSFYAHRTHTLSEWSCRKWLVRVIFGLDISFWLRPAEFLSLSTPVCLFVFWPECVCESAQNERGLGCVRLYSEFYLYTLSLSLSPLYAVAAALSKSARCTPQA